MRSPAVDNTAVIGDDDEGEHETDAGERLAPLRRLSRVDGPLPPAEPPPPVRLCREWKGPTVADLLRDEFVEKLPGRVRSALQQIERGDFAAADEVPPAGFTKVLAGPGHLRRGQRRRLVLVLLLAAVTSAIAAWAAR